MRSPGRTQFVVPASGHLADADGNHRRRDGLVVVDITGGDTYALPLDRQRMRLGELDDLHAAWIGHHFEWTRDSRGRERLVPRSGAKPMPWRGRIVDFGDHVEYRVQPVQPAMVEALRRFVVERLGARVVPDWSNPATTSGDTFALPGCDHVVAVGGHEDRASIYSPSARTPPWRRCQDTVRRIGTAFDAELSSGRLDRMFVGG